MVIEHTDIYTDLDILPIYNFDKCINGDLKYLYTSKKGEISDELTKQWEILYNKYCDLTANSETSRYYRLIGEINWLENRLKYVPIMLNLLLKTPKKDRLKLLKEVSAWKLPLNANKDLCSEIDRVLTALNNSKTKLKRKVNELEDLKKHNEQIKSVNISLQGQSVKIHKLLGVKPNIFDDSVTTWLAYWNEIKNLNSKNNG